MLSASLYIIVCSARNRIRVRLRRLREPRYLIGAIVGAAYFYFTIFARMWGRRSSTPRRRGGGTPSPSVSLEALRASGPAVVGMAFMVLMVAAWLFPGNSGLLDFTEPEIEFLFTAPVTRRQLLVHRLLRSQLGLLFAAIVPALIFPSGSPGSRARFAVSVWVILVTMKVHFTGITLARASLALRGAEARRRQWGALALMLAGVAIVAGAVVRSFMSYPVDGVRSALERIGAVATTGLPRLILWPFMALASPLFAPWPGPFLFALAAAVAVLGVNVVWVLRSDEAFQEAAVQAEARRAAKKLKAMPAPRVRATSWTLAPSGPTEMVFVWKNVMQMLRETNVATLVRYGAPFLGIIVALSVGLLRENQGVAALLGGFAAAVAAISVLLGPQMARTDLRQDLLHIELLKTWPVRASAVVRGEMLWPAAMLTIIAWLAIAVSAALWTPVFPTRTLAWRASATLAAAIVAPALVVAQLTIHNAAAVVFPAWVPLGTSRPRGIDAIGQRLIMFGGVMLGLLLLIAPGAITGGAIWFLFGRLLGPSALVPAAMALTTIVLIEVLIATEALGPMYERLDVTAVERSE